MPTYNVTITYEFETEVEAEDEDEAEDEARSEAEREINPNVGVYEQYIQCDDLEDLEADLEDDHLGGAPWDEDLIESGVFSTDDFAGSIGPMDADGNFIGYKDEDLDAPIQLPTLEE